MQAFECWISALLIELDLHLFGLLFQRWGFMHLRLALNSGSPWVQFRSNGITGMSHQIQPGQQLLRVKGEKPTKMRDTQRMEKKMSLTPCLISGSASFSFSREPLSTVCCKDSQLLNVFYHQKPFLYTTADTAAYFMSPFITDRVYEGGFITMELKNPTTPGNMAALWLVSLWNAGVV